MKEIDELVKRIDAELNDAKDYAECYIKYKVEGGELAPYSAKFKAIASQELEHASIIHELAVQKINKLKTVYTAPVEMQNAWDKSHTLYVERTAWIKQMLTM